MLSVNNSIELIKTIEAEQMLEKLVEQLNKDFQLANINEILSAKISANLLKSKLDEIVKNLVENNYDSYLNLVYRIDIKEMDLVSLKSEKPGDVLEQISFLILKREFQKVWLKQNYKKL